LEFVRSAARDIFGGSRGITHQPMAGDGSDRTFWRIPGYGTRPSLVAVSSPPRNAFKRRENRAYLEIGRHLYARGVAVPRIYAFDLDRGWFLMEDMGASTLQERVLGGEDPIPLYRRVLDLLFRLQIRGIEGFDPGWCCQTRAYDTLVMRRYESDYFADAFLGSFLGLKREVSGLVEAFDHMARKAAVARPLVLIHRDFQSRNILVGPHRLGIVDWQGARPGPPGYDLASLIIDPYVPLKQEAAVEIRRSYEALLREYSSTLWETFEETFEYLALQRNLQILGAFSFLAQSRGKRYFERYIPPAVAGLRARLLGLGDPALEPLREVVEGTWTRRFAGACTGPWTRPAD